MIRLGPLIHQVPAGSGGEPCLAVKRKSFISSKPAGQISLLTMASFATLPLILAEASSSDTLLEHLALFLSKGRACHPQSLLIFKGAFSWNIRIGLQSSRPLT